MTKNTVYFLQSIHVIVTTVALVNLCLCNRSAPVILLCTAAPLSTRAYLWICTQRGQVHHCSIPNQLLVQRDLELLSQFPVRPPAVCWFDSPSSFPTSGCLSACRTGTTCEEAATGLCFHNASFQEHNLRLRLVCPGAGCTPAEHVKVSAMKQS